MTSSGPADAAHPPRDGAPTGATPDESSFDLLVVGGGVSGACIALEAARAGLRTALVERDDFGAGTSANSLKILHGGLRDLRRLAPKAVRSGAREQAAWARFAPHLVEPLPFLLPTYRAPAQSRLALRAALAFAGLLSPVAERDRPGPWAILGREDARALVPDLPGAITGGALWYEGQMYSAERLVLEVVQRAMAAGAVVANHTSVTALLRSRDGEVAGARTRNGLSGADGEVRARRTVLATGSTSRRLAGHLLGRTDGGSGSHSLALNVVLPDMGYRTAFAVRSRPRGGGTRQLLFVPWRGRTLLGTGHYAWQGDPRSFERTADPGPLIEEANAAWQGPRVREEDVVLVHAGLLPLEPAPDASPDRLLRDPEVHDHAADGARGLISATSVRFSYARLLARRTVARVLRSLSGGDHGGRGGDRGDRTEPASSMEEIRAAAREAAPEVEDDVREHLVRCYGARVLSAIEGMRGVPDWRRRVIPGEPVIFGQFVRAARHEMAQTTADLIWRRTELGPRGLACDAAEAMAREALALAGGRGEVEDGAGRQDDGRD
ncbi:MAG TPA: FAD-dependent oxidoreductase [Longimicrobiales bacterium]|nr:FAD-dependent oxidoreductase [Longimicrobiales bacterium]